MQTKADFLAAFTRPTVAAQIGGNPIQLRPLTQVDVVDINARPEGRARTELAFARSLCAPDGSRLFADEEGAQILECLSYADSEDLAAEIARVSRLGDAAKKAPSPTTTA